MAPRIVRVIKKPVDVADNLTAQERLQQARREAEETLIRVQEELAKLPCRE